MAGIMVPIAIHLWNIRQGKILEVGTIRFMELSQKKRASNIRISEWLLLLLRCLTILLFAMLMAGPTWNRSANNNEKGWLLLPPNEIKKAYQQKSTIIDSLLKNGFQLHAFEAGFPVINLSDSSKSSLDSSINATSENYWKLASELSATASSDLSITIISSNKLRHFKGNKPTVNRSLNWMLFQDTAATIKRITNAWQITRDSIGVLLAKSSNKSFEYETKLLSIHQQQIKEFSINEENGRQVIRIESQEPILVDTNTIRISIFTDQYFQDLKYLMASLKAIREFSRRKVLIEVYKSVDAIPSASDLLFWLSDEQIPTKFSGKTVSYQKGVLHHESGFMYGLPYFTENPIALYQFVETKKKDLLNIWENGNGNPILAIEENAGQHYLLFTHFNPAWNELVWTNRFAEWMLPFVFKGLPIKTLIDERVIDPNQIRFDQKTNTRSSDHAIANQAKPITHIFWILLLLVFVIERILSFTSKNKADV
jgi:hypothetical protein